MGIRQERKIRSWHEAPLVGPLTLRSRSLRVWQAVGLSCWHEGRHFLSPTIWLCEFYSSGQIFRFALRVETHGTNFVFQLVMNSRFVRRAAIGTSHQFYACEALTKRSDSCADSSARK